MSKKRELERKLPSSQRMDNIYEQNVGKNMYGKGCFDEVSVEMRNMLLETTRLSLLSVAQNLAELGSCSSVL